MEFVWNLTNSPHGMFTAIMRSLEHIQVFIWCNNPKTPPWNLSQIGNVWQGLIFSKPAVWQCKWNTDYQMAAQRHLKIRWIKTLFVLGPSTKLRFILMIKPYKFSLNIIEILNTIFSPKFISLNFYILCLSCTQTFELSIKKYCMVSGLNMKSSNLPTEHMSLIYFDMPRGLKSLLILPLTHLLISQRAPGMGT